MIRNYLVIAFRNLLKHKVFSFINIAGLSLGIACCVLLSLYIKDEFSYERHFDGYEDIYRVTSEMRSEGREFKMPRSSAPVVMAMLDEFPEIENATRVVSPPEVEQNLIRYNDKTFYEKTGYLVDSTFFDVFSYEFQEGDRNTALDAPSTVVITAAMAQRIFGNDSPLHETIIINAGFSTDTFQITGVLKPYVGKSQTQADFYMCMNSKGWGSFITQQTTWVGNNFIYGYVKLKTGTSIASLVEKMNKLQASRGGAQMKESGVEKTLGLQPIKDARLYSAAAFNNDGGFADLGSTGNILYIYILGAISLFILIIACINFMNLTTAKASQRAGEVGVRKSLGANRSNLITQFLGESLAIVSVAMILSLGIVQIVLPLFNIYTQKTLSINGGNIGFILAALIAVAGVTGLLAGSYPAFFLSSFQPARVLKDKRLGGGSGNWLRKGLVVFQFVIAISLISSILVIYKQFKYIQEKSLGFSPEYRILLPLRTNEAQVNYAKLRDQVSSIAGVTAVAGATSFPSTPLMRDLPLYTDGSNMSKAIQHFNVEMDEDYFRLLNVNLIAGRNLAYEKDSFAMALPLNHIIVNRASIDALSIPLETAIGTNLHIDHQGQRRSFQIAGVVENFHLRSMHQAVSPVMFQIPADLSGFVHTAVSIEAGEYKTQLANIEKVWKDINPYTPFESSLLNENLVRQYENDERVLSMITTFTILAILISCLGLYGLSIYVAERKNKEIGIRKVLGASVTGIVTLLSKDFIKLVLIAFLISVPLSYYAMDKWLQTFAYKTSLDATVFVIGGLIALSIAWLTVSYESIRAATGNPVDSLKSE